MTAMTELRAQMTADRLAHRVMGRLGPEAVMRLGVPLVRSLRAHVHETIAAELLMGAAEEAAERAGAAALRAALRARTEAALAALVEALWAHVEGREPVTLALHRLPVDGPVRDRVRQLAEELDAWGGR